MVITDGINYLGDVRGGVQNRHGAFSLDDSLEAIASETRRTLLLRLRDRDPIDERTIENELLVGDSDPRDVRTRLHHVHLPKLEEFGIVEWDRNLGEIRRDWAFSEVESVIEVLDERSERLPGSWP